MRRGRNAVVVATFAAEVVHHGERVALTLAREAGGVDDPPAILSDQPSLLPGAIAGPAPPNAPLLVGVDVLELIDDARGRPRRRPRIQHRGDQAIVGVGQRDRPARWRVDRSTTIASLMVEAVHTGSAAWVLR